MQHIDYVERRQRCQWIEQQIELVRLVQSRLDNSEQTLLFVDAPGGCGKTYCFNCILAYIRSKEKVAVAVATTGIAALQLSGGKTAHTAFKIPIDTSGTRKGPEVLPITKKLSAWAIDYARPGSRCP